LIPRPLEIKLLKTLRELSGPRRILLAVSGGMDSMALLYVLKSLRDKVDHQFVVAHIHHGGRNTHRDKAYKLVKQESTKAGFEFVSNIPHLREAARLPSLKSEAALRKFRLENLKIIKQLKNCDLIVFAHHKEDLLETRLIRLIRGTGPQGLAAMSEKNGAVLRPFLSFSKEDLQNYLKRAGGKFTEDPTNESSQYLRNWLRNEWLPALEAVRPGANKALASSLEAVVESLDTTPLVECLEDRKIIRSDFIALRDSDKRRVLGNYLKQQGFKDYGRSHINELVKRLDVEQKVLTFRLLKRMWLANARHIWCE